MSDTKKRASSTFPIEVLGRQYLLTIEYDEIDLIKTAAVLNVVDERVCIAGWATSIVEVEGE